MMQKKGRSPGWQALAGDGWNGSYVDVEGAPVVSGDEGVDDKMRCNEASSLVK